MTPATPVLLRNAVLCIVASTFPRRPGARKAASKTGKNKDRDDSAALSFDDDLKAKLAEHNRGVTKGRHTYEPSKGRVKDWRKVYPQPS